MPAPKRRLIVAACAALATALMALPAAAQWVATGRWGTETHWRYVVPGSWMVLWSEDNAGQQRVSVSAEAENHDGRIEFWCTADLPHGMIVFDNYFGPLLQRPDAAPGTVPDQTAQLVVDEQPFEITLEYHPQERRWISRAQLEPELLDRFGWGSSMDLVNSGGETVARFRLNASGAARAAIGRLCRVN